VKLKKKTPIFNDLLMTNKKLLEIRKELQCLTRIIYRYEEQSYLKEVRMLNGYILYKTLMSIIEWQELK
jgi:hypothetical protein